MIGLLYSYLFFEFVVKKHHEKLRSYIHVGITHFVAVNEKKIVHNILRLSYSMVSTF